mgnify:CR=1 FL=1
MFNLISDYLVAGQVDNAQHLYDNMLKYAEQEYGKVSQMTAMTYYEKAHLYEQTGDLDNAIKMMQKSAEVFKKLPKNECNQYNDAKEFIVGTVDGVYATILNQAPDKKLYNVVRTQVCPNMKLNSLEKIIHVLETGENEVFLDEEFMNKAKAPLERMLELAK